MKKIIIVLALVLGLSSCSLDDDTPNFHSVVLPVEEALLPQEFALGETYEIKMWYKRPSTCHTFSRVYYEKELNTRIVAIENIVTENNNCLELTDEMIEVSFDFYVTSNGSYIFKFWKGKDDYGVDIFDEVEVPVID